MAHNNYTFWELNPKAKGLDCGAFTHLFFKRHLLRDGKLSMLAMVDADVAVVNRERRIESLFRNPLQMVVHEERFHNGKVHAGAYVARRGSFADAYLQRWSEMEWRLPPVNFHNGDNGALHLLSTLYGEVSAPERECAAVWAQAMDLERYDRSRYVGCAMRHVFNATSAKIRLILRGHGFFRDLWVTDGAATASVDLGCTASRRRTSTSKPCCRTRCWSWRSSTMAGRTAPSTGRRAIGRAFDGAWLVLLRI